MAFTKILPAGISTTGTVTLERVETTNSIVSLGSTNQLYINTDTPTVRPTLDLNFERDQRLDSRITFSRDSTATYLGSDGLIKTAQPNIPRFEFDTDGNCLGLLIEESRTNVGTYSEDFSQWTNDGVTISTNQTTSPDGNTTADLITGTSGNRRLYRIVVISNGPVYTYSIFVKKNVGSTIRFDNINVGSTSTEFNFDTGVLTLSGVFTSGTVTSYPNGWYRLTFTYTSNGDSASLGPYFVNTNDSCYMWGYQFELGSFPTSYIPTSGSAVTRSADNASITGTNFTDWFSGVSNASIFIDAKTPVGQSAGIDNRIISFRPTSGSNSYDVTFASGSTPTLGVRAISNYAISQKTLSFNTITKISASISSGDLAISCDGELPVTSSATISNTFNALDIGRFDLSPYRYLNSTIKQLTYYPQRLSNAQLQNLTS